VSPRHGLTHGILLALVAALAGWTAVLSWSAFTQAPDTWLWPVLVTSCLVGVLGAVLRWVRVPRLLVLLVQAVAVLAYLSVELTGGLLPTGERWLVLGNALEGAVRAARGFAAPVPLEAPSLVPFLLPGALAIWLLVDLVACGLRRAALAGIPLLAAYTVPVSLIGTGVSWTVFALGALAWLALLFVQELDHLGRWGRTLDDGTAGERGSGPRSPAFRVTAATVALSAVAFSVVVAAFTPTLSLSLLSGGRGPGDGDVQIENPMVDLRRDLQRDEDVELVRVQTDDPDPSYLRIGVLTRFSDNEWSPGNRDIPAANDSRGEMPPPEDGGDLQRRSYDYRMEATDEFDSTWLPTMQLLTSIRAEGDWRFDDTTRDFTALDGDETNTRGLAWSMSAADLDYEGLDLAEAPSVPTAVDSRYTELPENYPREAVGLAETVTEAGRSPFERAVILQRWFRSEGGFEYDLDAADGSGTGDLISFLSEGPEGRRGYCEQFAAAMAAMGRSLDIPSRVAVGFLRPTRTGPDRWTYSSFDMHAWTEMYFSGFGWVRFEPTPPGRASGVPSYTEVQFPAPAEDPSASASAGPGDDASALGPDRQLDEGAGDFGDEGAATGGSAWVAPVVTSLTVLLVALLVLSPRLVRRARSRRRAGSADPEAAWAELRDAAVDLGLPWPEDVSPRTTGRLLGDRFGDPDASEDERPRTGAGVNPRAETALETVVRTVEESRYARPGSVRPGDVRDAVGVCVEGWYAGVRPRVRRRARWWPRSVFRRTPEASTAGTEAARRGVVDHVG
jgi:transglutaminase-like putative cysteine protease